MCAATMCASITHWHLSLSVDSYRTTTQITLLNTPALMLLLLHSTATITHIFSPPAIPSPTPAGWRGPCRPGSPCVPAAAAAGGGGAALCCARCSAQAVRQPAAAGQVTGENEWCLGVSGAKSVQVYMQARSDCFFYVVGTVECRITFHLQAVKCKPYISQAISAHQ